MLLAQTTSLLNCFILTMIIYLSMHVNLAHAVFGQSDVPLEEYYNHGKTYTGVAAVNSIKGQYFSLGTANLIDVNNDALKGRVMITAAHVLDGSDANRVLVRFIDEQNNSTQIRAQAVYFPKDYKNTQQDIGFIVLEKPVETEKFKPLKLNLTKDNQSLIGNKINIMGCTDRMGHAGSNNVIEEGITSSLRRGMQTLLRYGSNTNPCMNYVFHHHTGLIEIKRYSEKALTAEGIIREDEIKKELNSLEILLKRNELTKSKDENLIRKHNELYQELELLPREVVREAFSQKLLYNDGTFKNQLATLKDTDDLDKEEVINKWNQFVSKTKDSVDCLLTDDMFNLGKYQITMFKPLPLLSGIAYHGDSGGAWIIENEIVALSKSGYIDEEFNRLTPIRSNPPIAQGLAQYFATSEKYLQNFQATPLLKNDSVTGFGVSIWSYKDWIESTIKEIISDLSLSS